MIAYIDFFNHMDSMNSSEHSEYSESAASANSVNQGINHVDSDRTEFVKLPLHLIRVSKSPENSIIIEVSSILRPVSALEDLVMSTVHEYFKYDDYDWDNSLLKEEYKNKDMKIDFITVAEAWKLEDSDNESKHSIKENKFSSIESDEPNNASSDSSDLSISSIPDSNQKIQDLPSLSSLSSLCGIRNDIDKIDKRETFRLKSVKDFNERIQQQYNARTEMNEKINKIEDEGKSIEPINVQQFPQPYTTPLINEASIASSLPLHPFYQSYQSYQSSRSLGVSGEKYVLSVLERLFPDLRIEYVGDRPHSCDIHIVDEFSKLLIAVEVKNKKYVNIEDISKFERDIRELSSGSDSKSNLSEFAVKGLFISLVNTIPRYGKLFINSSLAYISCEYCSDECISLIINAFRAIHETISSNSNNSLNSNNSNNSLNSLNSVSIIKYEVPTSVYKLLGELKFQYSLLSSNVEIYQQQIKANETSSASMFSLIAKTNVQKELIIFIEKEFSDILETDSDASVNTAEVNEQKLRNYLKTIPKSKVKKGDLLKLFPFMTEIKGMTLSDILLKYKD